MPQEFQVLQCFSCRTFQVHQVKKTLKWACKMCGEKQSVIKVYGQGSGADCRQHVQKLNSVRGQLEEVKGQGQGQTQGESDMRENHPPDSELGDFQTAYHAEESSGKWAAYVEPGDHVDQEDDESYDQSESTGVFYTTDATLFKSRKRKSYGQDRTQRKHPKFTNENQENLQSGKRTRQIIFTGERDISQENYVYDQVYHKPAHVSAPTVCKNERRKGTSCHVPSLPETGTSSSKWGMYVSNETGTEEHSSDEDNSDDILYDMSAFQSQSSTGMFKTYQNSNEGTEHGVSRKVSSSSKWSMFMSESQLANSNELDQSSDPRISEALFQPIKERKEKAASSSFKACVPPTSSKWGQYLDVESTESSPMSPTLTNKTETGKVACQLHIASSVANNSNSMVDTKSLFNLGELGEDDLEF